MNKSAAKSRAVLSYNYMGEREVWHEQDVQNP